VSFHSFVCCWYVSQIIEQFATMVKVIFLKKLNVDPKNICINLNLTTIFSDV